MSYDTHINTYIYLDNLTIKYNWWVYKHTNWMLHLANIGNITMDKCAHLRAYECFKL